MLARRTSVRPALHLPCRRCCRRRWSGSWGCRRQRAGAGARAAKRRAPRSSGASGERARTLRALCWKPNRQQSSVGRGTCRRPRRWQRWASRVGAAGHAVVMCPQHSALTPVQRLPPSPCNLGWVVRRSWPPQQQLDRRLLPRLLLPHAAGLMQHNLALKADAGEQAKREAARQATLDGWACRRCTTSQAGAPLATQPALPLWARLCGCYWGTSIERGLLQAAAQAGHVHAQGLTPFAAHPGAAVRAATLPARRANACATPPPHAGTPLQPPGTCRTLGRSSGGGGASAARHRAGSAGGGSAGKAWRRRQRPGAGMSAAVFEKVAGERLLWETGGAWQHQPPSGAVAGWREGPEPVVVNRYRHVLSAACFALPCATRALHAPLRWRSCLCWTR